MTTLNFPSLLSSTNVRAFLRLIRVGESNNEDDGPRSGYRAMYHPTERRFYEGPLEGPHPRVFELLPDGSGRKSSAFGAYQFVATTWDYIGKKYGLADDIKPYNQDCYAVALLWDCGALDHIIDGRLPSALTKAGTQWASLPDSPLEDGGHKLTYAGAHAAWVNFGGSPPIAITTGPAPVEDRSTQARPEDAARINEQENPMAFPILAALPLISSLIEAFSPLARAKVTKALDKQGVDPAGSNAIADSLLGIVKSLASQGLGVTVGPSGAPPPPVDNPIVAVATVQQNPALLAQAEDRFISHLDQLAPFIEQIDKLEQNSQRANDDSMDRAAVRAVPAADDWMAKALVGGILIVSGLLIALVAGVAITQIALLTSRTPTTEVWAALTGIIGTILGILGTVFAFRFGTNRQSGAKDVVIAELSRRNP